MLANSTSTLLRLVVVPTASAPPRRAAFVHQPGHARARRDAALRHQHGVGQVLAAVQFARERIARSRCDWRIGLGLHVVQQAFTSARHVQQFAVARHAPAPRQFERFKSGVERDAVTVTLGLGHRAIHVPQQRAQHRVSPISTVAIDHVVHGHRLGASRTS